MGLIAVIYLSSQKNYEKYFVKGFPVSDWGKEKSPKVATKSQRTGASSPGKK